MDQIPPAPPKHKTNKVNPPTSINQGTLNHQPDQQPTEPEPPNRPGPRRYPVPKRDSGPRSNPRPRRDPVARRAQGLGGTIVEPRAQEELRTGVTMVTMLNSQQFCKFEKGATRERAQFCHSEKEKNRTALGSCISGKGHPRKRAQFCNSVKLEIANEQIS